MGFGWEPVASEWKNLNVNLDLFGLYALETWPLSFASDCSILSLFRQRISLIWKKST